MCVLLTCTGDIHRPKRELSSNTYTDCWIVQRGLSAQRQDFSENGVCKGREKMTVFFWLSNLEKEQRVQHQEKEISRSRIPRLILRPHLPQQQKQNKVSPASESPFSEEESREFNPSSSGRSARTISSNSFCSGTLRL